MKKILFVLFALFATTSLFAQEDLHNLLHPNTPFPADNTPNKNAKKRFVSSGAFDIENVTNGLFVVKQQYTLRTEDGEEKTSEGKDFYGESYGLAVLTSEGYFVTEQVVEPWKFDSSYEVSSGAEPELSKNYLSPVTELKFDEKDGEDATYSETSYYGLSSFSADSDEFGFQLMNENGIKKGYLVLVESNSSYDSFDVSASDYEANLNDADELNVKVSEKTIGGIFVVPVRTNVGQITYKLAGVVGKTADNTYKLYPVVESAE